MNQIDRNERIKRERTKRINASDASVHPIQKRNARPSISNAPNVIKPAIEGLYAGPKRRIKMISQKENHLVETTNRMNLPHQRSY